MVDTQKKYTNDQIITWICKEFSIMHNNPEGSRLLRPDDLKIDMTMSFPEIMKKELAILDENMKALQKEKHPKKQAFISYRTYCINIMKYLFIKCNWFYYFWFN